jgi:hypothetical protein
MFRGDDKMSIEVKTGAEVHEKLMEFWDRFYSEKWLEHAELRKRVFPTEKGIDLEIVHNAIRDEWEKNKHKRTENGQQSEKDCPLCGYYGHDSQVLFAGLWYSINIKPTLRNHILVNVEEHRAEPTAKDFFSLMRFVQAAPYGVYMNYIDSGAGIPDHAHYQGQNDHHYPVVSIGFRSSELAEGKKGVRLFRPDLLHYCLLIEYEPRYTGYAASLAEDIHHTVLEVDNPSGGKLSLNPFLYRNRLIVSPRSSEKYQGELPKELIDAGMKRWQIAGQEMAYLFAAKFRAILDNMTRDVLTSAVAGTTLYDPGTQADLEKRVMKLIR